MTSVPSRTHASFPRVAAPGRHVADADSTLPRLKPLVAAAAREREPASSAAQKLPPAIDSSAHTGQHAHGSAGRTNVNTQ